MREQLQDFLKAIQVAFYSGDVEKLSAMFTLPLVVYSAVGVLVFRTREELEQMVADYRAAVMSTSAVDGELTILSFVPPVNRRLNRLINLGHATLTESLYKLVFANRLPRMIHCIT